MNELLQTLLSTLLTPVAFGLAVWAAWILRDKIRDLVLTTGLKSVGVSEKGLNVKLTGRPL